MENYDFSNAEQGKFYTKAEDMVVPHFLKPATEKALRAYALKKGKSPNDLLQAIVEKELALLQKIG